MIYTYLAGKNKKNYSLMEGGFQLQESKENDNIYSIGALSKSVGISTDTLRYYDEIGVLKPSYTCRDKGYRYYTDDQAVTLAQIMELKNYGFSLNEIKKLLKQDEVSWTDAYLNRYWILEMEKAKLQEAIDKLSDKIKKRQEDSFMGKKVLLVDDAPFIRSICKDILSREGYDVVGEACDGLEAVDLYKSVLPDIVLLDIVMPNCDGVDALRKIKEFDENAHVIMLSAMSQARMITETLLLGARDFIAKPFQSEKLLTMIQNSFLPKQDFNKAILQQIYDASINDTYILTQVRVDTIINNARTLTDDSDVASVIASIQKSPAEQHGYDPSIEKKAEIFARLDKLEQGQEEIKSMLRSLNQA